MPAVPWGITTIPPSSRHRSLLVAVNRAAAFNVAARWVLHDLRSPAQSLTRMADLIAEPSEDLEDILREACANLTRSRELLARELQRAGRTQPRIELAVDPALPAAAASARDFEHAPLNLVLPRDGAASTS